MDFFVDSDGAGAVFSLGNAIKTPFAVLYNGKVGIGIPSIINLLDGSDGRSDFIGCIFQYDAVRVTFEGD